MSQLLERDAFESFLRVVEARLPSVEKGARALRDLSREELQTSIAGTLLEPIVEKIVEEKLDVASAEREIWARLSRVLEEIREFAPEDLRGLIEAITGFVDAINIARATLGLEVEDLIPVGSIGPCLEKGVDLERCATESALSKLLGVERVSMLVKDRSRIPMLLAVAKLAAVKRILEICEEKMGELQHVEAVRNALAAELSHVASFCSLAKCPEELEKLVREVIGFGPSLEEAKELVHSKSGEMVIEAVSRGRERRSSVEEIEALVEQILKPLKIGQSTELLTSVILSLNLFFGIAYSTYVARLGVLRVG